MVTSDTKMKNAITSSYNKVYAGKGELLWGVGVGAGGLRKLSSPFAAAKSVSRVSAAGSEGRT